MHLGRCLGINAIALLTDYGDLVQKVYAGKRELGIPKRGIGIETLFLFLFALDWMCSLACSRRFVAISPNPHRLGYAWKAMNRWQCQCQQNQRRS